MATSDDGSDLGELRDDFSDGSQPSGDEDAAGSGELWSSDEDEGQPAARGARLELAGRDEGSESDDEDGDDDPLGGADFSGSDMEASDEEEGEEEALLPSERKAAQLDRKRCVFQQSTVLHCLGTQPGLQARHPAWPQAIGFVHSQMPKVSLCREQEEADAAAEAQDLATNIADAAMAVLPEAGDDADLATVGRRIQVLSIVLLAVGF